MVFRPFKKERDMNAEKLSAFLDSKMLSRHFKGRGSEPHQRNILKLIIPELLLDDEKKKTRTEPTKKLVSQ